MLSSYIATLKELLAQQNIMSEENIRSVRKSLSLLRETYKSLDQSDVNWPEIKRKPNIENASENIVAPTMEMIVKTATDIKNSMNTKSV